MTKTNKLPPLSEMGLFSDSNSRRNHPRRRAGTSMDHHAIDPPRGEVYTQAMTPNEAAFDDKEDPFYLG